VRQQQSRPGQFRQRILVLLDPNDAQYLPENAERCVGAQRTASRFLRLFEALLLHQPLQTGE